MGNVAWRAPPGPGHRVDAGLYVVNTSRTLLTSWATPQRASDHSQDAMMTQPLYA
jgi:hypothetical protein